MRPYAVLSDIHLHAWSAFAKTNPDGVNSRLQIILDEIKRAAAELKAAGGHTMYLAGDTFHVRGSIDPAVLNPTMDLFDHITGHMGIQVRAIPGNHDLAGKEADRLGNAAQALTSVAVTMVNDRDGYYFGDTRTLVLPWYSSPTSLLDTMKRLVGGMTDVDCIIHAPVNGVLFGIPDHGLDAKALGEIGFKRVFAGHFHNHVDFGNGVYSVGATTHQTWSDPGTRAGFLLVYPDKVVWQKSRAPSFMDIDASSDPEEVALSVPGNYVRVKLEVEKESEIAEVRESLMNLGAAGVVIHPIIKAKAVVRTSGSAKIGSLAASLSSYVALKVKDKERADRIDRLCQQILTESEEVT